MKNPFSIIKFARGYKFGLSTTEPNMRQWQTQKTSTRAQYETFLLFRSLIDMSIRGLENKHLTEMWGFDETFINILCTHAIHWLFKCVYVTLSASDVFIASPPTLSLSPPSFCWSNKINEPLWNYKVIQHAVKFVIVLPSCFISTCRLLTYAYSLKPSIQFIVLFIYLLYS